MGFYSTPATHDPSEKAGKVPSDGPGARVLLDCTLRDGGYWNGWRWGAELVDAYLDAMRAARVDVVELGLRGTGEPGLFADASDLLLEQLDLTGLKAAVMINTADLGSQPEHCIARLFATAHSSPVSIVRIAARADDLDRANAAARALKALGYTVTVNLMQVSEMTESSLYEHIRALDRDAVDVLYVADSLGALRPRGTNRLADALSSRWRGALGIHAHDNAGLAVANTVEAAGYGVAWLDSTVAGMGRGAGNAATELLLVELRRDADIGLLLDLVAEFFDPMRRRYGWGPSPLYARAAQLAVHPTYVQRLVVSHRPADALAIIERLEGATAFTDARLQETIAA